MGRSLVSNLNKGVCSIERTRVSVVTIDADHILALGEILESPRRFTVCHHLKEAG